MKNVSACSLACEEPNGCFGQFRLSDPVCIRACALRLRCAVERTRNDRMEMMEELVYSEDTPLKIQ